MTNRTQISVVARVALSDAELADVRALAEACARVDDLDLRIAWDSLQSPDGDEPSSLLAYQQRRLVGFLKLDGVGADEAEASGMVLPEHRRQGVFRALVDGARAVCEQRGTHSIVFVCDRRSQAAKAAFTAIGARYEMSEQKMRRDPQPLPELPDSSIRFQRAALEDADVIAQIIADDSGMDALYFRQIVVRGIETGARHFYVAKAEGATIGTINVDVIDGEPYIYGFVVRPEYRGRGYGKQILARTIAEMAAAHPGPIVLEVETGNDPALGLYHTFGFVVAHVYDYYRLNV
jgi:ribosomal protein S18 acetylase RimI-like enzyme